MSVVFCHKIYNSLKKLNICKNCLKSWFWNWIVVLHWTITVYNIIFFLVKLSLHFWLHSIMFPPRILHLRISPRKRKNTFEDTLAYEWMVHNTYGCASWRRKKKVKMRDSDIVLPILRRQFEKKVEQCHKIFDLNFFVNRTRAFF